MSKEIIKYMLPNGMLDHFEITNLSESIDPESQVTVLRIDLEEINEIPEGFNKEEYESKGFYPITIINDFPLRDKAVVLALKRRRWRHKVNRTEIHSNYSFIATGAKITQDLSDFLKETD